MNWGKFAFTFLFTGFVALGYAQNPAVSIATWKNNAQGAYSIIHDDFGDYGVAGIQNYADTMHYNRGLKFTFGAITASCEGNAGMYSTARAMIESHGHEIINHSHTHTCAVGNDWCTAGRWAEPATQNFAQEMTYSSNSIYANTGVYPRYFIYPYDLHNEAANSHLKTIGYIGSRSGTYNGPDYNTLVPDAEGFFRSAVVVDAQTISGITKAINLNAWVDTAVLKSKWVNRELHNVGSSGWGHVTVAEYRTHLNYLKQKVDAGQLWVGTVSEVLTYQIQRLKYTPTSSYNSANGEITISWNTPSFSVQNYLAPLVYKSPVTLTVDLSNHSGTYRAYQNNVLLTDFKITGNTFSVNVYPHQGPVVLQRLNCPNVCILAQPQHSVAISGQLVTLSVEAFTESGGLSYQWYKDGGEINGETEATLTITNVQASDEGNYYVEVSNGIASENSTEVTVTVTPQQPYLSIINIPGKIEAENFDQGGQDIAYNETSLANQGGAYRTEAVDIETCNEGGYNVGYIADGEWLEYSVNVNAVDGTFDFQFRTASQGTVNGIISLELDGVEIASDIQIPPTGGWQSWQIVTLGDISLSPGHHVLRVNFVQGNFNFNYLNVVSNGPLALFHGVGNSNSLSDQLALYPNPAVGYVKIKVVSTDEELSLSDKIIVMDLAGKIVKEEEASSGNNTLRVDDLPEGMYTVRIPFKNTFVFKKFYKSQY